MASSRIYRDLLLKKQHGLPLWIPDPAENLEEHKKQGISIGDLGILTDDGGFRFLFNIHAEADARINKDMRTPQAFTPLPMPTISKREFIHVEKACITENASVEKGGGSGAQANALGTGVGAELTFTITHERAAMLYLPHGADRENTDGIGSYKEYAKQHGESWYKFVNEDLKSDARNGSLYLVTGCDKSGSWALGAGSPRQGSSFKFAIQGSSAVVPASVTADFHVAWTHASGIEGRHYPPLMKHTVDVKNQCVFVRGLAIAIRKNWFSKPWLPASKVHINEVNNSTVSFSAVDNNVPFQSTAKQNPALLKAPPPPQDSANESRSGDLLDQEQDATNFYAFEDTSDVIVEDYPEQPKPVLSPASYICEHLLSTRPDINLVIVHDNDWMTVTSSDDENIFTSDGLDYERLTTHVLQKCHLQVTRGTYQDLAITIEGAIPDLLEDEDQDVRAVAALLINEFPEQSINNTKPELATEPSAGSTATTTEGTSAATATNTNEGDGTWIVPPEPAKNAARPPLKVQIENPTNSRSGDMSTMERDARQEPPPGDAPPSSYRPPAAVNPNLLRAPQLRAESTYLRPPPENIYEELEKFFPKHDLDRPIIEATSGDTSPINAEPTAALPPPVPVNEDKARIRAKKSIRIVAQEHRKKIDRMSKAADMISQKDNMMRKRSTKLWGSRLEEVITLQGRNNSTISLPESPSGGPTTFKWVRGELIGKGTYGRVYLALNATTGEMMAVKQVELPQTTSDKNDSWQHAGVQALKMESETLRDLDHPNIVQYLGFEETPANLSIFLEYVPGGSVGSCLHKHGKFADNVTRSFTAQILSGLEYLHSKGIFHQDMKADDILVEMSGICKISDFGISKRTEDLHGGAFTAMQGTVFWMAPEVMNAQKKVYNIKADIWSVGCVVLEMWTGMRPWMGEEMVAVMFKLYQSKQPPPVPEDIVLSEEADDFRRKCFAINSEERPSAAELGKHPYLTLPPGWIFTGFT